MGVDVLGLIAANSLMLYISLNAELVRTEEAESTEDLNLEHRNNNM